MPLNYLLLLIFTNLGLVYLWQHIEIYCKVLPKEISDDYI